MRLQLFGEHTGLVVSEFSFGAGNLGNRWGYGAEPDEARAMFHAYVEAGGNFIDSADVYQFGQSEELLGELLAGERNNFVIASKYTSGTGSNNFGVTGNSRKNMIQSVEDSLRRLKTDHIDIYWVHYPDQLTPIDEIVRGMEDLARAGKIVYAGLSDFPAWRASRAFTIAELRGWVPIAGMQIEYSLVERTPDRELLPMAEAYGMGLTAWSILGGGLLTGKYRRGEQGGRADTFKVFVHGETSAQRTAVLDEVHAVADELGVTPGQVAIAWVRDRGLIPIIGPRTKAQLDDNLGALSVHFSEDQFARLNAASAVPLGFPHEMVNSEIERKGEMDPYLKRLQRPTRQVV